MVSSSTFNKRFMNFSPISFHPSYLSIYARSMTMAYIFNGKIHHHEFFSSFFCFFFLKAENNIKTREKVHNSILSGLSYCLWCFFLYSFFFQKRGKYESAVLKPSKQAGRQHKKGKYKVEEKNIGALTFLIKHYIYNP